MTRKDLLEEISRVIEKVPDDFLEEIFEHGTDIHFRIMRRKRSHAWLFLILVSVLFPGCRKEYPADTSVPGNDQVYSVTFYLERIDSARYWGDSEKIRLKTGLIRLFPENSTYEKKFFGTADETIDPSQADWSKESSGKYSFSPDSAFLLLNHDPEQIRYFPGNKYTPTRLEQHDSVWYTISFYSMAISGNYIYSAASVP